VIEDAGNRFDTDIGSHTGDNPNTGIDARSGAPLGLYIHIPFCARKCPYCDFNTFEGMEDQYAAYVGALCAEMARWAPRLAGREIATVFVGGGTPTVLGADQLEQVLGAARRHFALAPDCEVTSEANPGSADRAKFRAARDLGVNRLSLGVQSLRPDELRFLGRVHDVADVYRAFDAARAVGFDNVNLDFMFGLPDQRDDDWRATLREALALAPEHLSLYSLIVEPNTPLYHWVHTGRVPAPDDDRAADLYAIARESLAAAGYVQYEVSNWARGASYPPHGRDALVAPGPPGSPIPIGAQDALIPPRAQDTFAPARACRHNLVYWRNQEYLGLGPGAHSHLRWPAGAEGARGGAVGTGVDRRWANIRPVPGYVRAIRAGRPVEAFREDLDPRTAMGETMMLGLRLVREGVVYDRFARLHGRDLRDVFPGELETLVDWGLITCDDERVRLTGRGLLVGNQVFARFV